MHTRRRRACAAAAAAAVLLLTSGGAGSATAADAVRITFDDPSDDAEAATVVNVGAASTSQRVHTDNDGSITLRGAVRTGGRAARYPAFDGSAAGPRAVVGVTNAGPGDQLSPGPGRFALGADVSLDAVSTGGTDNGNNVLQRGLYGDPAQYKMQVDDGVVGCRVKGEKGELTVSSSLVMGARTWYRASCVRRVWEVGDLVEVSVAPIRADGSLGTVVRDRSAVGAIGRTRFDERTPLSVGGKLTAGSSIHPSSDQFNGLIDNAFLRIP